jgi:hypothetical protein
MKDLGAPEAKIEKTPKDSPIADGLGIFSAIKDLKHVPQGPLFSLSDRLRHGGSAPANWPV